MKHNTHLALGLLCATLLAAAMIACAPATVRRTAAGLECDPVAGKALAQKDHCTACHGVNKQKSGPSYSAVAKKYYGNPNAEADLYEHLMAGNGVKRPDGYLEFHKCIANEKPEKVQNMVRWVLSQ
ncbi:MAG: c-type cytochrome [Rhodoferax sp.]